MGATNKRQLYQGKTIWQSRRMPNVKTLQLLRPVRCDTLVVGAGISGAMLAEALSAEGQKVIILDRRRPLQGSTAASTSLIQYEIDTPLSLLSRKIGKDRAGRIWRRSRLALDALRERIGILGIEAACSRRDTLYLDGDVLSDSGLQTECRARREIGLESTFLAPREVQGRFGIRNRSALMGYDNIAADPIRLAAGFLRSALENGAKLYSPCEAEHVEPQAQGVHVETRDGPAIKARNVIFATGYELPKHVPRKGHSIISTWAMATKSQPRAIWPEGCFIWEAADPYLYMRPGPDGRVICGGEDEDFGDEKRRNALTPAKIAAIEEKLAALFPRLDPRAQYAWTGNFGKSETGTPSIGPIPRLANCYAVLGYGGNGITFSMLAAQLLRNLICGNGDADSDLFSFTRSF